MAEDLSARGFGQLWGHTRSYSNQLDSDYLGPNGYRWFIKEIPQLGKDASGNIAVIGIITEALWFNKSGANYVARHFIKETLVEDTVNKEFVFRDTTGRVLKFFSFDATIPAVKQGQFKSYTDPYGHTTTPTYDASNRISSTVFGSGTTRGYYYDYYAAGNNAGRMQYATIKRGATNVRRVEYLYYDTGDSNGSIGDLKSAKLQQWNGSSWDTVGTTYYRYYTSGTLPGLVHGLKYIVNQEAYARMVAAGITPETATDLQVGGYADFYYEYDASKRVVKEKIRGGLMTYQYAYSQSAFGDGYNNWKTKTTETLPDNNQNIVYTNYAGQIMLKVFNRVSDSAKWYEYYLYDSTGLVTQRAESNAVASYSEASAGLVTLNAGSGLIQIYDYYATTDVPNGAVAKYLQLYKVKQGSGGTPVKVREWKYTSPTVGANTIYPISKEIVYFSDASGGSNPQETSFTYTWFAGTFRVQQRTTTLPIVPTSQYGSGVATSRVDNLDEWGRLTWFKNERLFLTRWKYDDSNDGLLQRIDDVQVSSISDSPPVPSGWTTPSGGGLHLINDNTLDDLGRITQSLGPVHSIDVSGTNTSLRRASWTVYKDAVQEVRTAEGYATGTFPSYTYTLIEPITVLKFDRQGRLKDRIVSKRDPLVTGALTATESFTDQTRWARWTNSNFDNNGRLTYTRLYFLVPSSGSGTSGTNYNQTDYGYTAAMAWLNEVTAPGGTIRRTVYHARGWVLERWVGTNDTGATETNPAGTGAPNNMVKVESYEYDSNAAGANGLLTKVTQHENASTTRVTTFGYDFRNRRTSQSGELNFYEAYTYDNLDRITQIDQKNGSGGNLIGRRQANYNNKGQVYQNLLYAVNPSTGVTGNSLIDKLWYDPFGNVIKIKPSGGNSFRKLTYDGINRVKRAYICYQTTETDTDYAAASTVTSDTVVEQNELTFDGASNLTVWLRRRRFHDTSGTGELNGPTSSSSSANFARVTYQGFWPDPIGRTKAVADVGTNAGSSWTRPAVVPTRSNAVLVTTTTFNTRGEPDLITDQLAIVTQLTHDDAGRLTKRIENYINGGTGADQNRETQYTYTPDGLLKYLTAKNSVTGDQVTKNVYGSTLTDSDIASNELLRAVIYPDSTDSDNPLSGTDHVEYKYNRLGEMKERKDQIGTVRLFIYDKLARLLHDRVFTLGTGVDGTVRRISRTYEVRGLLEKITSYNNQDPSLGTVLNEVQFAYNNFSQVITEYQEHAGAVNTGTSLKVQYGFADGSANHIRPTSLTYPDTRIINFNYGSANSTDDLLSRIAKIQDGASDRAIYNYLGTGDIIKARYEEPGVDLTYIKQGVEPVGDAGDQYTGLDRFDRVIDQRWIKTSTSTAVERVKYGYDRGDNRQWRQNVVAGTGQDEYYTYDGLSQLTVLKRGTLNAGKTDINGTPSWEEDFAYDKTGNWGSSTTTSAYVTKDDTGAVTLDQKRTHSKANEVTGINERVGDPVWTTPAQNGVGNMTSMPEPIDPTTSLTSTWDAWNRMVTASDGVDTYTYKYDGLNRRTTKVIPIETREFYYSQGWQVLEERVAGAKQRQYIWGLRYPDDLVFRDRDASGSNERRYAVHDYSNVTGITDTAGTVQERYNFEAFGTSRVLTPAFASSSTSAQTTDVSYGAYYWDKETGLYQVRNRYLHARLGRWVSRDPIDELAFPSRRERRSSIRNFERQNLYAYVGNNSISKVDPSGLKIKCSECDQFKTQCFFNLAAQGLIGGTVIVGEAFLGAGAGIAVGSVVTVATGGNAPVGAAAGIAAGGALAGRDLYETGQLLASLSPQAKANAQLLARCYANCDKD